jgi:2-methylfumaryl-CoA isomerase
LRKVTTPAPLSDLRVIEISAFVAAPLAGATLAALGADVIRVDPPGGGLDVGRWPLYEGRSLYWAGLNQGKRSVTIDTHTEIGRRQLAQLVAASGEGGGIVLTNLPVSDWNSYEALRKLRSDLIMVVITGNRDGTPAVDYTVNAAIGFPFITGPLGYEGPINHVLPAWDAMAGMMAAMAVLAADRQRRLTGAGQLVELSLADVGLAVSAHLGFISEAILVEEPRGRNGNELFGTFGCDFRSRDGKSVMVLALTQRQWRRLSDATNMTQEFANLAARLGLDFRDEGDRWRGRKDICRLLEPWVGQRDFSEVRATFDRHGVLWGRYQTFKQLVAEDPSASVANPMFAEVVHPGIGPLLTTGSPIRFGESAEVPPQPAPELGQHTAQIFDEFGLED